MTTKEDVSSLHADRILPVTEACCKIITDNNLTGDEMMNVCINLFASAIAVTAQSSNISFDKCLLLCIKHIKELEKGGCFND